MSEKNSIFKIGLIILAITIVGVVGFTSYATAQKEESYKNYVVSLNDLYSGHAYISMASSNLERLNRYISINGTGYTYNTALTFITVGKEQSLKAVSYFEMAKETLNKAQYIDEFYAKDIQYRTQQINSLKQLSDDLYTFFDYSEKRLYEVNYGSKTVAQEYMDKYNALALEFNGVLKEAQTTQSSINVLWNQEWYT
jgi:hypothetical protein